MATYTIPPPTEKIQRGYHDRKLSKKEWAEREAWLRETWKKDSEEVCPLCKEQIGYDRPCFNAREEGAVYMHAICYVNKLEEERKQTVEGKATD